LYSINDIASFVGTTYDVIHAYIRYHHPDIIAAEPLYKVKPRKAKIRIPKPTADKLIKEIIEHRKKKNLSLN
jgi:hypothetical protein